MLVALLVIATTQAKPVVKVTPKKHATEQVVDQNDAAQDEVAQDEAVEDNPDAAVEEAVQAAKEASEKPIIDKDGIIIFKDGETVKVTDGPFKGAEGHIVRIKKDRRLVVTIRGVAAVATTFIHPQFLEPAPMIENE